MTATPPAKTGPRRGSGRIEAAAEHGWMLVPGLLFIYLGFDAGGYFAGTTGLAAVILAGLCAVRMLTAPAPLRVKDAPLAAVIGIAALTALSILSRSWSHETARALLSFDLCAIYLLVTVLQGSVITTSARLRTLLYGLLGGLAVVCGAALLTRLLPHTFPLSAQFSGSRLAYPLTYWNALGMVAALAIGVGAHVASDREAPAAPRIIAAALVPMFAATLLLTFSRGAIGSLIVLLVIYVVLAPRVSALLTAVAVGIPSAITLKVVYDAGALGSDTPTSPTAVSQGHHAFTVVVLCMLGAAALRGVLLLAEPRIPTRTLSTRHRTYGYGALALIVVLALVAGSGTLSHQYESFIHGTVSSSGPARGRLLNLSNDGRLDLWRVAEQAFNRQPLHGNGAGTYSELWYRYRTNLQSVQDAHNLYLQTLAELGLAGIVALAVFLLSLLIAAASRLRLARVRPAAALATGALIAWALHSAVDWDWQMPAVMMPVFALAATVGAADPYDGAYASFRRPRWAARIPAAVVSVALGVAPLTVAISQQDLDSAVNAFAAGDCPAAIGDAQAAHGASGSRPEPLEIIGYCQARMHDGKAAEATLRAAVTRDPGDWEFRYAQGLVTAEAGDNPIPVLKSALVRNPAESSISGAIHALAGTPRSRRRAIALRLPLDLP